MKAEDKKTILKNVGKYAGGIEAAIAAHLYGDAVVVRSGGQVLAGVDHDLIADLRTELVGAVDMTPFLAKIKAIVEGK